jgi:tetratricopeptide (TPR) repeat protein
VLLAGAAAYFVPEYLNPRGGPPPLGSDAQPASASVPSPSPTAIGARLPEAADLLAAGRWNDAAGVYADIATASPNLAIAQAGWARALLYANKPSEAVEHAQKAADLEPRSAEYQALLAQAFDWSGNVDRAITSARRATELDANLPEAQAELAEVFTDKFRLQDAQDALNKAVAAGGGDNPEVMRVQAYLLETQADYAGAVDAYKRAIERTPQRSYLHLSLGAALRALKRNDEAIQAYQRAAELNPQDARAATYRHALGWVYYNTKQYPKARQAFTKALELNPDLDGARDGLQALDLVPSKP